MEPGFIGPPPGGQGGDVVDVVILRVVNVLPLPVVRVLRAELQGRQLPFSLSRAWPWVFKVSIDHNIV